MFEEIVVIFNAKCDSLSFPFLFFFIDKMHSLRLRYEAYACVKKRKLSD